MKKLTKKQAWEWVMKELENGYKDGICILLSDLISMNLITENSYQVMSERVKKCRTNRNRAYLFPLNDAGRKKRIKLCRKFIQELS